MGFLNSFVSAIITFKSHQNILRFRLKLVNFASLVWSTSPCKELLVARDFLLFRPFFLYFNFGKALRSYLGLFLPLTSLLYRQRLRGENYWPPYWYCCLVTRLNFGSTAVNFVECQLQVSKTRLTQWKFDIAKLQLLKIDNQYLTEGTKHLIN